MQFDVSAGRTTRMAIDRGDATDNARTIRRTEATATPGFRRAREDNQLERERMEADLFASEQLFWATFDRAVFGIAHVSLDGQLLRVNQRFCDLLGYSREEIATRTWHEIIQPDDLAAGLTYQRRLLAGELDAFELDKRYRRRDGLLIWVHITALLVRTSAGEPDYFITMVQDITERKRLEEERAELLERERAARALAEAAAAAVETTNAQLRSLQALTDTALSHLALDDLLHELVDRLVAVMGVDHIAIFLLDEDGQALTLRAGHGLAEEHVGWVQVQAGPGFTGRIAASRAPLIVDDLTSFDVEGVHPTLRVTARSAAGVPLLVAEHAADRMEGAVAEGRLVGVLVVGSATPRRFTEADMLLLQRAADRVALAIDRARLYAAEQEARRQAQASEVQAAARAERLNTILETMADGVVVYDQEGYVVQSNRAYRELASADRLPGFAALPVTDRIRLLDMRDAATGQLLPLDCVPGMRALRGEVVSGPDGDHRIRALDGREIEMNVSAAPLRDRNGCIVGAVSVLRDLTERKRLEREREAARADELAAHEANRRMEQFLATAAHDLRTPLTTTIGYLDLAQHQAERLAATVREAYPALTRQVVTMHDRLEDADQSAERLARLLTLLFDTAEMRTGRLELHRAPCDLAALVCEQVAALQVVAPGRSIHLQVPMGAQPIPVEIDADRIRQVVTNFVVNALKYAPPEQPIDVSVLVHPGRAQVAVCDRGPGIPEVERSRVWEPFHRVLGVTAKNGTPGGATAGVSGSLGLGLHICKAIVEAHGGQIGLESAIGKGSTFWFTLPLSTPMSDLACATS